MKTSRRPARSNKPIRKRVADTLAQLAALKRLHCTHKSSTQRNGKKICLDCEVPL